MFKNWARNQFNDDKIISSFKIQALVYNVNNEKFSDDIALNFIAVGNQIYKLLLRSATAPIKIMSVCGSEDIIENWDIANRNLIATRLERSLKLAVRAYQATAVSEAEEYWKMAFNL